MNNIDHARFPLPNPLPQAGEGANESLREIYDTVGKMTHQDVGQLDMYVRVFDEQQRGTGDNPTIGLIMCSERNAAVAKYSALADNEKLFASKYQTFLPSEEELRAELERDRALLESEREKQPGLLSEAEDNKLQD